MTAMKAKRKVVWKWYNVMSWMILVPVCVYVANIKDTKANKISRVVSLYAQRRGQ